jgi:hypothetical protein
MKQITPKNCRPISVRQSLVCFVTLLVMAGTAIACQVPVFRYALERWSTDRYPVWLLTMGELSTEQKAVEELLRSDPRRGTNVKSINLQESQDPLAKALWSQHSKAGHPLMISFYPQASDIPSEQVAHVCALTSSNVTQLLNSPARMEIVKKLTAGDSAVWVFLESGDKAKDEAALQTLQGQLEKDASWLELPSPEELEVKPEVLANAQIQLKIAFSIVKVRRDDQKEKFLVDCLLNSEPDLRDFAEPMAFPVFGRGRVLYALVGKGISANTIRSASSFIVGPCSCQVKEQNPGFDLLLDCEWEKALGGTLISSPAPGDSLGTATTETSEPKLLTIPPGRSKQPK